MSSQPTPALQGPPPGLTWGIKGSFMRYLSAIEDTTVAVEDGASLLEMGAFNFTLAGSSVDASTGAGSFDFHGKVALSAHAGMLSLVLRNPRVDIDGTIASLSIDGGTTHRLVLCELEGGAYEALGSDLVWSADQVHLTVAGAGVFGGQYPPGQELDPVRLRIPL
ncbi:MAG: HtaA domain-containing protein [Arthrobacter sp.]|nr:HtaA domain-containing protein [Arthrobacter sp.]